MCKILSLLFVFVGMGYYVNAAAVEFSSSAQQTTLLELYTSEGCSSCPAADRWLSGLKGDASLWRRFIPVAFHVDYWNSLGWRDRFSDARYSERQNNYKQHRYVDVVYTPGFVKNGREWRGWYDNQKTLVYNTNPVGVLKAILANNAASVEFLSAQPRSSPLLLNVAWLGFDQVTEVASGENSGHRLSHDFVVLGFRQYQSVSNQTWRLSDLAATLPAQTGGVALWVTTRDDPTPLQATGGFLQIKELR